MFLYFLFGFSLAYILKKPNDCISYTPENYKLKTKIFTVYKLIHIFEIKLK